MKKRMTSLFLALVLCLGLLPVTALADAPSGQVLYVGGEKISTTGYWTTDSEGNVAAYSGTGIPTDNYIHYDADDNTLTLHNATIKKELGYSDSIEGGTYINGSAIGVFNQNGNAELTIQLQGQENTLSKTSTGIHVYSHSGTASLTITGSGSLNASGFANPGISVQSNNGDATLTIQNAEVTATSTHSDGVRVLTAADKSASLTVDGGSLTATATGSNSGIYFQFVSGVSGSGTPRLTVCGNTIVKASGDTGGITSNSSTVTPSGTGIVFNNGTGTVYGSVTLQEDLTIGEGESLTIPEGASLDTNGKTITVESGGKLEGEPTGSGTVKIAPTITTESLPGGTVGEPYTETILAATGDASITWSVSNGSLPAGLSLGTDGTISGKPTTADTYTFTVKAENNAGSDSKELSITISAATSVSVTGVTLNKTSLTLGVGKSETLTATITPSNATNPNVTWSSSNASVATVENGVVTAVGAGTATITATVDGKSATCTVTVTAPPEPTPPPYIPPTYAVTVPETTGGTVTVSPSRASSGRRVTITTQPAPGYELESLTVLDSRGSEIALTAQGDGKYTFTMPSRKVTVQASFAPAPLPFEDVPPGAWYESAVRYVYTHGIMEGMSATTFVPGKSLTRAEAVQVLYNLEGQPTVSESTTFPDLVYEWYKPAISWAESTGVVDGYEDGTFQPGDSITRQEFAQMLYNYAKYKGHDLTAEGDLSSFPDGDSVQPWAETAMTWANGNELINGHDDGTLEPGGTTTRAQAASILMRFDRNLAK